MTRGLLKSASVLALGMALSTTAFAADLGGNCCADLEERVAELEATTARKGTRKVSLTVYGWVNKLMLRWDDGVQNNNYMGIDNTNSATRFGFRGDAGINSEWKAGYSILLDVNTGATSAGVGQRREEAPAGCAAVVGAGGAVSPLADNSCGGTSWTNDHAVRMRDANVWLESNRLGRVTLGRLTVSGPQGTIDLGGIGNVASGSQSLVGGGFAFRNAAGALTNRTIANTTDLLADYNNRVDGIKWDSPTLHGFVFGASIGEALHIDRQHATAAAVGFGTDPTNANGNLGPLYALNLRYAGEFNGVRLAAAIGYEYSHAEETMASIGANANPTRPASKNFGLSGSLMHTATGLFLQGHWIRHDRGNDDGTTDQAKNWILQAGVARNWFGIGNTALYGEYSRVNNGFNTFRVNADQTSFFAANAVTEYKMWGLGVTQNIDAAAMQLYAGYRNHSLADNGATVGGFKDIDMLIVGARINF